MLVSVIIPVYNVEKYLAQCIESVLSQRMDAFELLLVDDGSTDGSGAICDAYAARDKRIRVWHCTNGGAAAARNIGIDHAAGEWICFIDSDDYVDDNYLSAFVEQGVLEEDCFNVQGRRLVSDIDGTVLRSFDYPDLYVRREEMAEVFAHCDFLANSGPVEKLFNKRLLDRHHIRFSPTLTVREDALFVYTYRLHTTSLRLLPVSAYYYRQSFSRPSLSSFNHPYHVYRQLKHELLPLMRRVFEHWGILEVPRAAGILSRNKNQTCLSIIKALYAYDTPRRERIAALHDIFDDRPFFTDPYYRTSPLLRLFRTGCRCLSIPLWDALCYLPFRFYYRVIRRVRYRHISSPA